MTCWRDPVTVCWFLFSVLMSPEVLVFAAGDPCRSSTDAVVFPWRHFLHFLRSVKLASGVVALFEQFVPAVYIVHGTA